EVAVIGGGNVACEDAGFLAKVCSKVYLIHRRDELRATPIEAKRILENEKIEKVWNSEVIEIIGEKKLEAIKIINKKTNEEKVLPIEGLFVAIGRIPSTDFAKDIIELKENGYVVVGKNNEYPSMTTKSGIFAAGDCMDETYRQAIVAAGAGAKAAIDVERWLNSR
ncbi:MAG: FAD-dependent oxidoreductase, partial [Candidatus Shapirobacteria bacterium]